MPFTLLLSSTPHPPTSPLLLSLNTDTFSRFQGVECGGERAWGVRTDEGTGMELSLLLGYARKQALISDTQIAHSS